jgi:hypothetical protein
MATLYDLAMQYLNQSLPKTFKYDRTNQPGTNPPGLFPQPPVKPIEKLLPVQGGDGAYNPYNPDPNSITNKNYSPYAYRQAMAKSGVGIPSGILSDSEFLYGKKSPLEGIMSMMPGQQILKGLASKLPVNRRAIYENELAGQGIMVNDIGQIVASPGNINTAENIMAGYNAAKVDADTFAKRRKMIEDNMKDPKQKAAKLKALAEAEEKMLGTAKTRADAVFDMKSLAKDPDYKSTKQLIDLGIQAADDDSEDEMLDLDYTNPNIYNTNSIYTSVPTSTYDRAGIERNIIDEIGQDNIQDGIDRGIDRDIINRGGGDDLNFNPPGAPTTLQEMQNQMSVDRGTSGGGDNNPVQTKTDPNTGLKVSSYDAELEDDRDTGGGGNTGGGKIVCTMMNESYGFGSFRNKIWMKFHKDLSPEYQKGYHKLFLPLVKLSKTNKVVKKILEHIAVHSTIDMRQATRGKMHLLGRIYRKILLPLCYIVGKHGKSSS